MASNPKMDFRSNQFTVFRLQEELRRRKLPEHGRKAELIERLESYEGIGLPKRSTSQTSVPSLRTIKRKELSAYRTKLSIWKAPLTILWYFGAYMTAAFREALRGLLNSPATLFSIAAIASAISAAYMVDGPHRQAISRAELLALYYGWWVMLGIASSIGLGTGLHTFVLFLGPHIAKVTLTAYKCNGLDFDDRGLHSFVCHSIPSGNPPSLFDIYGKVKLAVFFWGMGTSIGELPPYFIARAAAAAGRDDPDFVSIERILEKIPSERTITDRVQVWMYELMQKFGFFGILLCASVPNPLFDLAGIICGHFSVPFLTFWGATFVGKALIKNTFQSFAIVVLFSEGVLEGILGTLKSRIPAAYVLVQKVLDAQLRQFGNPEDVGEKGSSLLGIVWNLLIGGMVGYFGLSLIEALALQELRRQHEMQLIELSQPAQEELDLSSTTKTSSSHYAGDASSSSVSGLKLE